MEIISFLRQSLGFFDGLIFVLLLFNLCLLLRGGRSAFGIPPDHKERISSLILELFPVLGILGTVWGLSDALLTIDTAGAGVEIGPVARKFGGALTSTFFGLSAVAVTLLFAALHPTTHQDTEGGKD